MWSVSNQPYLWCEKRVTLHDVCSRDTLTHPPTHTHIYIYIILNLFFYIFRKPAVIIHVWVGLPLMSYFHFRYVLVGTYTILVASNTQICWQKKCISRNIQYRIIKTQLTCCLLDPQNFQLFRNQECSVQLK